MERPDPPSPPPRPGEDVSRAGWLDPVLVGEVQYRQFTGGERRLRHTSWRGLRQDRHVSEVHRAPRATPTHSTSRPSGPL
ncbi:ATP dependent DNA ligase [Kibdelosporangium aridum]|uniref:ATP dependent DNA ligase n=1 Tax=Kibdelosporangium aridum TaxID=2030 RepID=UPI001F18885F|nr:hypothetical protein [Kibdelosporangium aridum]